MAKQIPLSQRLFNSLPGDIQAEAIKVAVPARLPSEDVRDYLEKLHQFEQASRRVVIRVGGEGCGYCRRARELQQGLSPNQHNYT